MDVINETDDDVIYEVDQGRPRPDKPQHRVNTPGQRWCDETSCRGRLHPGEEHNGLLEHSTKLLVLCFRDKNGSSQLAGMPGLAAQSRWALTQDSASGGYRIERR